MYTHIFQDNKAKVLGGTYITHPPGSPHTERLHMCYTHICTHIHTHIHTYTYTYICVYICTYIHTYVHIGGNLQEAAGKFLELTYITWMGYIHMYSGPTLAPSE